MPYTNVLYSSTHIHMPYDSSCQVVSLDELERQFVSEFDYRLEAANLWTVAANMRKHQLQPAEVVVPSVRQELCSQRLLVTSSSCVLTSSSHVLTSSSRVVTSSSRVVTTSSHALTLVRVY